MDPLLATLTLVAVMIPALIGISASAAARQRERTNARLAVVENKLDVIMRHLGIPVPSANEDPEVLGHLSHGRKIPAIRVYRQRTGATLGEAKEAVERIAREHGF